MPGDRRRVVVVVVARARADGPQRDVRARKGRRVRIALERTQTWGEGPGRSRTLVTAPSSDRPSRSPFVVPRFGPSVQSELTLRAPTPWTSRYARRVADTAAACSPSARRATAAMPTARRAAARPLVAGRCRRLGRDTSAVPRAVSTIATGNALIVTAAA